MLKRFIMWVFTTSCPNCESAYTGGHPDPDNRKFCIMCTSPKTGEMREWIWRPLYLSRITLDNNMKKFRGIK